MLGCFKPNLDQIWTNPNVGLKMSFKNFDPTSTFTFNGTFFKMAF